MEIFELQNKVRTNPKAFISYLERCLTRFNSKNVLMTEDGASGVETSEGPLGYVEAIEFLRT